MKSKVKSSKKSKKEDPSVFCDLPLVPDRQLDAGIDPNRLSLIRYIEKKWVNHTVLHYHFIETQNSWKGAASQKQVVRDSFKKWKNLGIGLVFEEVNNPDDAEIRIGFEQGAGSWSYVGRDCIDIVPDHSKRTMNFGWDLTTPYGKDTAIHEIGHALGFPHEHQNPNAGIIWDEQAVYDYFAGYPNYWPEDKTRYNVIRKISQAEVQGSKWDKNSIMHYDFPAGLIKIPAKYKTSPLTPAPGLSNIDISEVKKFYPPKEKTKLVELKPYLSKIIKIGAGEQLDFEIKPIISRSYTMKTFGPLDTVMVLFEDDAGNPVYLAGNDDSGSDLNAEIQLRLISGRTYYLRVRLYYSNASGQGAVMLW